MRFGLCLEWGRWVSTVLSGDVGESAEELNVGFTAGLIGGTGTRWVGNRGVRGTGGMGWGSSTEKLRTSGGDIVGVFSLLNILMKPLFLCFRDLAPCPTALSGVSGGSFRCFVGRLKSVTTL